MLEILLKIQKQGCGRYSIDTILKYYEYAMQYDYYRLRGATKMESYEWAGVDCGIGSLTIMEAVKVIDKIKRLK